MVEHRPLLTVFRHVVLIGGVALVAFPLWVAFVASTLSLEEVIRVPMQLVPARTSSRTTRPCWHTAPRAPRLPRSAR